MFDLSPEHAERVARETNKTYASKHIPAIYERESGHFWRDFPEEILEELRKRAPGTRAVDLGCGPGDGAVRLREAGFSVSCFDKSGKMLRRAIEKGFPTEVGDLRRPLPYGSGEFDLAFVYTALTHVPLHQTQSTLAGIRDILAENGALAVGVTLPIHNEAPRQRVSRRWNRDRLIVTYTPRELLCQLGAAGFDTQDPYVHINPQERSRYLTVIVNR